MQPVEVAIAVIGLILTWTGSVIGLMLWLTSKFRSLEGTIYRETNKLRIASNGRFEAIRTRVQRLEIKAFGFTGPMAEPSLESPTVEEEEH